MTLCARAGAAPRAARRHRSALGGAGPGVPGGGGGAWSRDAAAWWNANGKGLADQRRSEKNDHQRQAEPGGGVVVQPSLCHPLLVGGPVACVRACVRHACSDSDPTMACPAACMHACTHARTHCLSLTRTHAQTHTRTYTRYETVWTRGRFLACVLTTVVSWDKLPIW